MSALTLRFIACATMLIDHVGAILFPGVIIFRIIGRLSFPIYAYLIANGFRHTRNVNRYLQRLVVFALISEIPYDLAFNNAILEFSRQNIFFTLSIALGALMLRAMLYKSKKVAEPFGHVIAIFTAAIVAELTCASYGMVGIVTVFLFDVWLDKRINLLAAVLLMGLNFFSMGWVQAFGVLAFVPIMLYNGKPGAKNTLLQYAFYLFYPLHLVVLHLIDLA